MDICHRLKGLVQVQHAIVARLELASEVELELVLAIGAVQVLANVAVEVDPIGSMMAEGQGHSSDWRALGCEGLRYHRWGSWGICLDPLRLGIWQQHAGRWRKPRRSRESPVKAKQFNSHLS